MSRTITITIGDALAAEITRFNALLHKPAASLTPNELKELDALRDRISLKLYCSVNTALDQSVTPQ